MATDSGSGRDGRSDGLRVVALTGCLGNNNLVINDLSTQALRDLRQRGSSGRFVASVLGQQIANGG